mmetsp:Transcript_3554/g.7953  ORF Transcript_3554/g.7953 Transcript_3554/m.7953 type:complete len:238 (+) Transcript_3554:859-1572(+)
MPRRRHGDAAPLELRGLLASLCWGADGQVCHDAGAAGWQRPTQAVAAQDVQGLRQRVPEDAGPRGGGRLHGRGQEAPHHTRAARHRALQQPRLRELHHHRQHHDEPAHREPLELPARVDAGAGGRRQECLRRLPRAVEGAGQGRRLASRSAGASGGVGAVGAGAGAGRVLYWLLDLLGRARHGRRRVAARGAACTAWWGTSRSRPPLFLHSMVEVPRLHAPRHTDILGMVAWRLHYI